MIKHSKKVNIEKKKRYIYADRESEMVLWYSLGEKEKDRQGNRDKVRIVEERGGREIEKSR